MSTIGNLLIHAFAYITPFAMPATLNYFTRFFLNKNITTLSGCEGCENTNMGGARLTAINNLLTKRESGKRSPYDMDSMYKDVHLGQWGLQSLRDQGQVHILDHLPQEHACPQKRE
ncbi:hypothetical protein LIER_32777 [Lithospermum erythrorhizon]|uniref:Uncharacterized protein n=1 Tax=Lithospermum erythrorhizon TaxID=34254 RepID=A0AAV3RX23_LITER